MSNSFRNHRIVIASLFLPTIAVLGDSGPPTPKQPIQDNVDNTISAVTNRLVSANIAVDPTKLKPLNPSTSPSASGPWKSIVEDLKDKVQYTLFTIVPLTFN